MRRQHGATQTTHFAPPQGKFEPIKSEQQEHMSEVLKKRAALQKHLQEKSLQRKYMINIRLLFEPDSYAKCKSQCLNSSEYC